MIYKIGDRVKFTFLGEELFGEIISKIDKLKWKVKDDSGMFYPFIYANEPKKVKGVKLEKPLGIIINKI